MKRVEGDRVIIGGEVSGNIFPLVESEVPFCLDCDGTVGAGFRIEGSLYGRQVRTRGSGRVAGGVVGRGELVIDARGPSSQRFFGGLTASGSIEVLVDRRPIREALNSDVRKARVLVKGDVVGENIVLRDTVVFGNIHATRVVLENCVVFGAIVARGEVVLRASTFLYYYAGAVSFEGPCMALQAMGESVNKPVFAPWEDVDGTILPPEVVYYPVIRRRADSALSNRPWHERPRGAASGKLYESTDWVRIDIDVPDHAATIRARDGVQRMKGAERWVLSIAGRAMNLGMLNLDIMILTKMIRTTFEYEHFVTDAQEVARRWFSHNCTADEYWVVSELVLQVESQERTA